MMPDAERSVFRERLALVATLVVSALLVWPTLDRGWTPHDDGMLAQTAERIRLGQLPHRDFEELYTGGLGYWHALMQSWFGSTLMAARYGLFLAWVGWLAIVFSLVRRANTQVAPWWSAGAVITIALWTLPVYPSAMPSWYLLFVGTGALAALLRWQRTQGAIWLLVAGAAIGVGLTIKITALYLLAAALLALVIATQRTDCGTTGARLASLAIVLGIAVLTLLVVRLLRTRLLLAEVMHLVVPVAAIAAAVADREFALLRQGGRTWRSILEPVARLLAGVAIPIALFALPYLSSGALDALVRGVFLDALGRVGGLENAMKPAMVTVAGLLVVVLAGVELRWGGSWIARVVTAAIGLWLGWTGARSFIVYQIVWEGARWLLPAAVLLAAVRYARTPSDEAVGSGGTAATAAITAAFAALLSLNQYPFSAPVYFCFVAPLAFVVGLQAIPDRASRLAGTLAMLALFVVVAVHPGDIGTLGQYPGRSDLGHRLALPRGGLRVSAADSTLYTQIAEQVAAHRGAGGVIAGPGLPEVTFLSGPPYRGRLLFHLIPYATRDSLELPALMGDSLPDVVVWNLTPAFGEPVGPHLKGWFDVRFPEGTRVWNGMRRADGTSTGQRVEIRWRN